MRSLILSATLTALATLATAPANAEIGSTPRYHYETCTCTFGYGKALRHAGFLQQRRRVSLGSMSTWRSETEHRSARLKTTKRSN